MGLDVQADLQGLLGRSNYQVYVTLAEIWQALLPACDPAARWQPVLVAALDPPIPAVRFLEGEARASSETRLVMTLPGASGS